MANVDTHPKEHYQVTRAAELQSLPVFRQFIDSFCDRHEEIDDAARYDLKLAVDEACTNIISYGYAGIDPGSIVLSIKYEANQVLITITDFGHPFEPAEPPKPDLNAKLEDRQVGGFGLFFIYETMDLVDYDSSGGCNCLFLLKQITPPALSAPGRNEHAD